MAKFVLEKIELDDEVEEVNPFFKLKINDKCPFDSWWEEMENAGNYTKELRKIQTWMLLKCQGHEVPPAKFKPLKGRAKNDRHLDFEIKDGDLRVYLFIDSKSGNIVVFGAIKKGDKHQQKDIKRMREIKLEYFKEKENED